MSGGSGGGKLDYQGNTQLPRDAFRRSGVCELVLRQCKLFEIPLEVFELTGLVTLAKQAQEAGGATEEPTAGEAAG